MTESFEAWWYKLGPVTKGTIVIAVSLTLAMSFGWVHPMYYIVDMHSFFFQLQLWRPITACLFLGKLGFSFLFALAMTVIYTKYLEEAFEGRQADLAWLLTVVVFVLHVVGWFLGLQLLSFSYLMSIVWIFCRRNPDAQLSLYMFQFKAVTFPFALMAFHLLMGQSIVEDLVGVVAGHVYIFLTDILPKTHNLNLIPTPGIYRQWLPNRRFAAGIDMNVPLARQGGAGAAPQQHRWGGGRVLGAN